MEDRRKFTRLLFEATAYLQQNRTLWNTKIIDLSLNGALVEKPNDFFPAISGMIYLSFTLPTSLIEIEMEMQIIHANDRIIGCRCIYIDMENISHLKKLLMDNGVEPKLLEQEFELALITKQNNLKKDFSLMHPPLRNEYKKN